MRRSSGALRRLRTPGDDGAGLILVIGVTTLVMVLAVTAVGYAVTGIAQSRNRTQFERSLAVAEGGVDRTLAELQQAFDDYNLDYPVPSPPSAVEPSPWCNRGTVSFPAAGLDGNNGLFSTEAAERAWATTQLEAIRSTSGCTQTDGDGEYVVLKPVTPLVSGLYPKSGKVYALSAVPTFGDPSATRRLVKSEYVFMPFRPTHAVLSGGEIAISSSTAVTAAYGVDPALASVHSNAIISGSGNPTVSGPVTSTGASTFTSNRFPGSAVVPKATQRIPDISARTFYTKAPSADPAAMASWYDLCPDGTVKTYSVSGPCTSTTVIGNATSARVRGWEFQVSGRRWIASRDTLSGTYYAFQANIEAGNGNADIAQLSLIAEAVNADTCATKQYGVIQWDHYVMKAPAFNNIWMYADADIITHSNFTAGSGITSPPVVSGMFIAGDQISMQTSSAGAVGSVLVANECPTPSMPSGQVTMSEIKNPTVYYDPNSDAPFTSIITTSLWLDYSGG